MCDADKLKLSHQQLLQEITTLLAASAEPCDTNALRLNQELQRRLEQVRRRMLELLELVRARYKRNEQILIRRQKPRSANGGESVGQSGAVLRGGTFRFKGNLYFRDVDGRSCPNNEDYESRCGSEMFPTDFDMRSKHVWTVLDKKNVVMGIKQQLVDHANYQTKAARAASSHERKRRGIDLHVQTVASLLDAADSSFSIDWNQISTLDLEHRHSSYSCEAMWLVYLQPQLKRDEWTTEEDNALLSAAKAHKLQNWQAIAAAVHQRSDYQCFVRMQTTLRFHMEPTNALRWGHEDNARLRAVVAQNTVNGLTDWSQVVEHFPGRSRSTLIGRYMYVLHPSISHAPFTPSEDLMLFAAVEEYNGKFNCFPRTLFPNRSLAQLRTRYNNVLAQRNKTDPWSMEDDTKLMSFVTEHGTSQWVKCASHLGNHTRTSCRTRFLVIKRFLEQNPQATVADIPRRKTHKKTQVTAENWAQRLQEWQADPDSLLINPTQKPKPKKPKLDSNVNGNCLVPLHGMDLHVYEYFKYSYNLQLDAPQAPMPLPRNERNLFVVANALRFKPPADAVLLVQSIALTKQLNRCYSKMFRQLPALEASQSAGQPLMLLPPNWSTMMGFRAICILSVHCRNHAKIATDLKPAISYDESQPAVQLFRQRLRTLFYYTTLLSRLEPPSFEQLPAALTSMPRPIVNYGSSKSSVPPPPPAPQPGNNLSGLSIQELARRQIEELDGIKQSRQRLKTVFKDELNVKQELNFD
ncbi:snRNA-activating protein complex subunit 4 [Drosophila virilis]|uniref:snRNA-activating protein complex subunit 4 n=1 Tax=Drosophila virilis TaxID=7244 RepID=B4M568_DROVI|nr:snRNA-activating protein complex subunit 4 [Drosophila virilis]EDW59779.1 uncharacterized protein Dvir_GJ11065 [Drosophila virilis]